MTRAAIIRFHDYQAVGRVMYDASGLGRVDFGLSPEPTESSRQENSEDYLMQPLKAPSHDKEIVE